MGQLKTSLSHLEYENEQLKTKTAKLEKESRTLENRLVQEQIDNGDLTARLDDARNLLRDRGLETDVKHGSRRRGDGAESFAQDDAPRGTDLSTDRPGNTPARRKPPFAQISGQVDDVPPVQDVKGSATGSRKRRDAGTNRSGRVDDDGLDHQILSRLAPSNGFPSRGLTTIPRFRFADSQPRVDPVWPRVTLAL